jgi:hypothetical protein
MLRESLKGLPEALVISAELIPWWTTMKLTPPIAGGGRQDNHVCFPGMIHPFFPWVAWWRRPPKRKAWSERCARWCEMKLPLVLIALVAALPGSGARLSSSVSENNEIVHLRPEFKAPDEPNQLFYVQRPPTPIPWSMPQSWTKGNFDSAIPWKVFGASSISTAARKA